VILNIFLSESQIIQITLMTQIITNVFQ